MRGWRGHLLMSLASRRGYYSGRGLLFGRIWYFTFINIAFTTNP